MKNLQNGATVKITLIFIQLGKPAQNAYIERFNVSTRRELLNAHIFRTLKEVREKRKNGRLTITTIGRTIH